MMPSVGVSYVMKVTSNGQVSIPAATRNRWQNDRVVIVDLGDRIVMRPTGDDPVAELVGKYAGEGPSTDEARRRSRHDEHAVERRRSR